VTVIIPTRGRPELVRTAIAAVAAQTYPGPIECIVVHDQEPVNPELGQLGAPRRSVASVPNTHSPGLAGSRNTGLDLARGDLVAGCDDDDSWHPDKLEHQVARLLGDPDLIVVGSGIRLMLSGNRTADWSGRSERISYQLLLRNRVKELHSSTMLMRRDAFAKAGRYDEKLPNGYAEDYDWVLRAARVGRVGVVAEPLANIRKETQSWYRGNGINSATGLEYLLAKHPDIASSPRGHARMLGQIAFARSLLGERKTALHLAVRGMLRWPASPHPYLALAHTIGHVDPARLRRVARYFGRGMA
jgi:glycosyltransferase involved in cell wall biosynthesis